MCVLDMSNPPDARDKDFFASPALSLSLAGIFRGAESPATAPTDSPEDTVEISSENSGPARSRSEDELIAVEDDEAGEGDRSKKRKKYHRHTAEQIREMEALFKESPHPDEKQRQDLSKQLGLSSRQVKFWFQNRRTQIKAIQERHENSLLKGEIEKLREENRAIREALQTGSCPNCGFSSSGRDVPEEKLILVENSRLRAEVEKLRSVIGNHPSLGSSPSSSYSSENPKENKIGTEFYTGVFGLQKSRILEIVERATDELKKIAAAGEPLWMKSVETGREILNYDEYMKQFSGVSDQIDAKTQIEASKGSATVFVDLPRLVQSFVDVNKWKEMFPSLVSRAATIDVICTGEDGNNNGNVQLIFAELQVLSPMVPTREVYFVRHSKQLNGDVWAIVDVSIDNLEENIDSSLMKCRKRPSGCIIEDKSNGHCKVTWIEHSQCKRSSVHSLYRAIVNSGQAFGAKRWLATLRSHCEQIVFSMATNVPTKDSSGVNTLAGRKSTLNLAQRMTSSFCRAIGGSSRRSWTKVATKAGDDLRFFSRKNANDPGEPPGLILSAASSISLPVPPDLLFEFLSHRIELWHFSLASEFRRPSPQTIAHLAKGQHRGNAVTIRKLHINESAVWMLQDSSTNACESMVVYAPVDIPELQSVMAGCNSNNVAILSSGFSIMPDGMETRPLVITSKQEKGTEGSLLTVAFQVQANPSPSAKLTTESIESVSTLVSTTLRNIRARLQCDEA